MRPGSPASIYPRRPSLTHAQASTEYRVSTIRYRQWNLGVGSSTRRRHPAMLPRGSLSAVLLWPKDGRRCNCHEQTIDKTRGEGSAVGMSIHSTMTKGDGYLVTSPVCNQSNPSPPSPPSAWSLGVLELASIPQTQHQLLPQPSPAAQQPQPQTRRTRATLAIRDRPSHAKAEGHPCTRADVPVKHSGHSGNASPAFGFTPHFHKRVIAPANWKQLCCGRHREAPLTRAIPTTARVGTSWTAW